MKAGLVSCLLEIRCSLGHFGDNVSPVHPAHIGLIMLLKSRVKRCRGVRRGKSAYRRHLHDLPAHLRRISSPLSRTGVIQSAWIRPSYSARSLYIRPTANHGAPGVIAERAAEDIRWFFTDLQAARCLYALFQRSFDALDVEAVDKRALLRDETQSVATQSPPFWSDGDSANMTISAAVL